MNPHPWARGGARSSVSAACPRHLAGLPPRWAKACDAGETRARSAGQRPGFLSKCLRLGFLLTEGRLQRSSDIPSGGSQGPGRRARPAGTRRRSHGSLRAAVRQHSQGRWGQAWRAIKGIPLGREEAVNQPRNPGAQARPGQTARACLTYTPHSTLTDPSLHSGPPPSPPARFCLRFSVSLHHTASLCPGWPGNRAQHPDGSPPWF